MDQKEAAQRSELATLLETMLDKTNTLSRSEWAKILNVPESKISDWLEDNEFPSPESLRRILRTLEEDPNVSQNVIQEFKAVSAKPLTVVAPHAEFPESTLAHYMVRTFREAFLRVLDTLPPDRQEQVLLEAGELCRKLR